MKYAIRQVWPQELPEGYRLTVTPVASEELAQVWAKIWLNACYTFCQVVELSDEDANKAKLGFLDGFVERPYEV